MIFFSACKSPPEMLFSADAVMNMTIIVLRISITLLKRDNEGTLS